MLSFSGKFSLKKPYQALILAAVFFFCLGTAAVIPTHNGISLFVNSVVYDSLLSHFSPRPASTAPPEIVVLDIDDDAVKRTGQWPWPRYQLAILFARILQEEPQLLGVDLLFSDEDRSSLDSISKNYQNYFDYSLNFDKVPQALMNNDTFLASTLKMGHTAGCAAAINSFLADGAGSMTMRLEGDDRVSDLLPQLPAAENILENIPPLQASFSRTGLVNTQADPDGVLRRLPLFFRHGGSLYPSVSTAFLLEILHCSTPKLTESLFGPVLHFPGKNGKSYSIPVYKDGTAAPSWRKEGRYTVISVNDLIDSNSFSILRGKVVLVGCSATGIHDWQATPLRLPLSSAEILASFLADALESDDGTTPFITIPSWHNVFELFSIWFSCFCCTLFFLLLPVRRALAAAVLYIAASAGASTACFAFLGVFLPLWTGLAVHACLGIICVFILQLYAQRDREILDSYRKIAEIKQLLLESTAMLAEIRTMEKNGHIKRTQNYVRILAEELRKTGRYSELTDDYIDALCHSAPLHDIGKMTIPDAILFKPAKLSFDEFELMKTHSRKGAEILQSVSRESEDHFLDLAAQIALTHHEKWDGSGYPCSLKGTDIPLCGRIMALADVYDALTSKRVYKPAFPHEKARSIILEGNGSHFAPDVVQAFLNAELEFIETSKRLCDLE